MHKRARRGNSTPYLPVLFSSLGQKPFSRFTSVKPIVKDVIWEEVFYQAQKDPVNFKSPELSNTVNCV